MNKVIIYKTNLEVGFGKKVLITGASSGLGRELSIIFARHGFIVYAVARRETELQETIDLCIKAYQEENGSSDKQQLLKQSDESGPNAQSPGDLAQNNSDNSCSEELQDLGSKHRYFTVDLANQEELQAFYEEIKDQDFEYLILNAGVGFHGKKATLDEIKKISDLNFTSQAFLALNVKCSRIISICSPQALFTMPNRSLYAATKAALNSLSLCLQLDESVEATICYPRWFKSGLRQAAVGTGDREAKKGAPEASKVAQIIFRDALQEQRISCLSKTDAFLRILTGLGGQFQKLAESLVKKAVS